MFASVVLSMATLFTAGNVNIPLVFLIFSLTVNHPLLFNSYSTVPPHPPFIASVSLRCDGTIVINTANFLHVLTVQVEYPTIGTGDQDPFFAQPSSLDEQQANQHECWELDSERSYSNVRSISSVTTNTPNMSPACASSGASAGQRNKWLTSPIADKSDNPPGESEYDFMEDASEPPRETISAFRKRRLADKKYEFKDENTENVPLKVMRKRRDQEYLQLQPPSVVVSESKDTQDDWEWNFSCTFGSNDVLRPFNSNIPTPIRSPEWEGEEVREEIRPPRENSKISQPSNCVAQFHRRYFEVDDELVSVITDIEGKLLNSPFYLYLFYVCNFFILSA